MRTITANNVNDALSEGLHWLRVAGEVSDSRNGRVLRSPEPVATTYLNPCQRVLFSPLRDANPFFHHMEAIWMLAGANDVLTPSQYAKQIAEYSDDGVTLNGAYGYRWRKHFGYDQLTSVIELLRRDPSTRRAVIAMWDGGQDLDSVHRGSLDVPCNTNIFFSLYRNKLNMTVCCRSNDAVWGAYGANAVHFSMLQQFVAEAVGAGVGVYVQISNDFHAYVERPDVARLINAHGVHYTPFDIYAPTPFTDEVKPLRMLPEGCDAQVEAAAFLYDAEEFVYNSVDDSDDDVVIHLPYRTLYFNMVTYPMRLAWLAHKAGRRAAALEHARNIAAPDWSYACISWLERRYAPKETT